MTTVTVSPKYQIVIRRNIRESMEIHPGEEVQVLQYENRIELIPAKRIKEMRGILKAIDTTIKRNQDRV